MDSMTRNWKLFPNTADDVLDEIDAYLRLEAERWPDGPICPWCSCTNAYFLEPRNGVRPTSTGNNSFRRLWKCAACRRQFSVLVGTWLQDTKVPLTKWFRAIELLRNGDMIPVRALAQETGTTTRTALNMRNRIRQAFGFDLDHHVPVRVIPRSGGRGAQNRTEDTCSQSTSDTTSPHPVL